MASSQERPRVSTFGPFLSFSPVEALPFTPQEHALKGNNVKEVISSIGPYLKEAGELVANTERRVVEMFGATVWGKIEDVFSTLYNIRMAMLTDPVGAAFQLGLEEVKELPPSLNPPLGVILFPLFALPALKAWALGAFYAKEAAKRGDLRPMKEMVEGLQGIIDRAVDVVSELSVLTPISFGILGPEEWLKQQVIIHMDSVISQGSHHLFSPPPCGKDCLLPLAGLKRELLEEREKPLDVLLGRIWIPLTHPFVWFYLPEGGDEEAYLLSKELFKEWVSKHRELVELLCGKRREG